VQRLAHAPRCCQAPIAGSRPIPTLGYGRLGPTEARLALIALLVAVALGAHAAVPLLGTTLRLLDLAAGGAAVAMTVAGAVRAAANLCTLAVREPYPAA
jgi:archaetidylinositol phosphate synthase